MTEENELTDRILDRIDKLDEKFDTLRKELTESFVLKQVFEMYTSNIRTEINEIKNDHKARIPTLVSYVGAALGALAILNNWFHFIGR